MSAFNETLLGGLLVGGALVVFLPNYESVREINLFGVVLLVQSVPCIAAAALAVFENTRFNSFAFWHGLEAKFSLRSASIQLRSPPIAELTIAEIALPEPGKMAEERIEAAAPMAAAGSMAGGQMATQ